MALSGPRSSFDVRARNIQGGIMREAKFKTPWLATAALTMIGAFLLTTAFAGINRWTSSGPDVAGVNRVAIDPTDPAVVYAASRKGVFKSSNGGLSWTDPSNGELDGVNVHSLAVDPLTTSNVYVGTAKGILKSTDGGARWNSKL